LLFLAWELLHDEEEKEKGSGSFFEKKNQKTFGLWLTLVERLRTMIKSLLLLFFRKEMPFLRREPNKRSPN
jgi:hypothetical protein